MSDRGRQFMSASAVLLGVTWELSSSHHPQTDERSKNTNKQISAITSVSPFLANQGRDLPSTDVDLVLTMPAVLSHKQRLDAEAAHALAKRIYGVARARARAHGAGPRLARNICESS